MYKNKVILFLILIFVFLTFEFELESAFALSINKPDLSKESIKKHTKNCDVKNKAKGLIKRKPNLADSPYFKELNEDQIKLLKKQYKEVTKDDKIIYAVELLKGTIGNFSREAILGNNLTQRPMVVEFKDFSNGLQKYASFDALGHKKSKRLYISINIKHQDAPPIALAALLSHEALHQDEFDSLNEETYAWTMEASVWYQLSEDFPQEAKISHPLVNREEMLKKLLIKGNFTDKYIRKSVFSNPGYNNLPSRSPGFEDEPL